MSTFAVRVGHPGAPLGVGVSRAASPYAKPRQRSTSHCHHRLTPSTPRAVTTTLQMPPAGACSSPGVVGLGGSGVTVGRGRRHRQRTLGAVVEHRLVTCSFSGGVGGNGAARGGVACGGYAGAAPGGPSAGDGSTGDGGDDPAVSLGEWWNTFTKAPWDEAPKTWKQFWAIKVAAAVVEVDVAQESVNAKEVEGIGLNAPKDGEEALERVKCNLIFYRQNYALLTYAAAVVSSLRPSFLMSGYTQPLVAIALLAAGASAACASDTLLGELSMLSKDKLVWNATRVAGLDRTRVRWALAATAAVAYLLSVDASTSNALGSLTLGLIGVLTHAVMRPIDLRSTLSNLWKDVTKVQTREEAEAVVKKGVKGIQSWWKNRRPNEPTPVIMSVKDDPNNPGGFGAAAGQARRAAAGGGNAGRGAGHGAGDDIVDTTGGVKPVNKGALPPGKK